MSLWDHQQKGVDFLAKHRAGAATCIASPTGSGKSRIWRTDMERFQGPTLSLIDRNLLCKQMFDEVDGHGIPIGVIASEHPDLLRLNAPHQLAMVQTLHSKIERRGTSVIPPVKRLYIDEAHKQKGEMTQRIIDAAKENGADVYGFTATPVGLSGTYDGGLEQLCVNSDLMEIKGGCGALIPAMVYAPDEPGALLNVKKEESTCLIRGEQCRFWLQSIIGNVLAQFAALNPERRPSIGFAPGVKESRWFVDQFEAAGYRSAHIDGEYIYRDGQMHPVTVDGRKELLSDLRAGRLDIVWNRFVLREGIDIPELFHCILATPIGSISAYLQIAGRVLRNHSSLDGHVQIQDHGANWWRHGSPNMDRHWAPLWDLSEAVVSSLKTSKMKETGDVEIRCEKCGMIRSRGPACPNPECLHPGKSAKRRVVQKDGSLQEVTTLPVKKQRVRRAPDTEKIWRQCVIRCEKSGRTFAQARGLFVHENHYYPPSDLPLMPVEREDWHRPVKRVPKDRLIGWRGEGPSKETQLSALGEFT